MAGVDAGHATLRVVLPAGGGFNGTVPADDDPSEATRVAEAVDLAARLLRAADASTTRSERRRAERLGPPARRRRRAGSCCSP